MHRTAFFVALLAFAVVAASVGRAANPPGGEPQTQSKPEAPGDQANPEEPDLASILAAFGKTKTALADAVGAAEKAAGGKAVDATFEPGKVAPVYRVTVYRNDSLWEGLFDADTGKAAGDGSTTPGSDLDDQEKKELAAIVDAKATLLDAIKAAEAEAGGKTIDAGIDEHDRKVWYQIAVVKSGAVRPVLVDPVTGKAQAVLPEQKPQ